MATHTHTQTNSYKGAHLKMIMDVKMGKQQQGTVNGVNDKINKC